MLAPTHIVLLGLVILLALVVFGPKRLPELGHSVGRAITEFKSATTHATQEFNAASSDIKKAVAVPPISHTEVVAVPVPVSADGVRAADPTVGSGLSN